MTPPVILALDCAAATGWALGVGAPRSWGVVLFESTDRAVRWRAFHDWLADMVTEHQPGILAYEKPIFRGGGSLSLAGYAVVIEMIACAHDLMVTGIGITTIKKHAGVKGKIKPIAAAQARGWNVANSHEADACWLLDYVASGLRETAA